MKPVKFLKRHGCYNVGEIAGFKDNEFKKLINEGIAKPYVENEPEPEPELPPEIQEENILIEVLRQSWTKIKLDIESTDDDGFLFDDETIQKLIEIEEQNKNRAIVKKGLQDEIIRRLETKASEETA